MCHLYKVTRAGYYQWQRRQHSPRKVETDELARQIQAIDAASGGIYGSPRIYQVLLGMGWKIGRHRVERLMRRLGIIGRCGRIYRSKRRESVKVFYRAIPNRSLEVEPTGIDQVWLGDITYIKVSHCWRYLAVVMDKYSRRVIGWSLGSQKNTQLTLAALERAWQCRKPGQGVFFHSDRGIEYGSNVMRERLEQLGFVQSMNRPEGKLSDNAHMESFFHTLKAEQIHGKTFSNIQSVDRLIEKYIPFYNEERIHSSLGYVSPLQFEGQSN
jgi:putative transposase